MNANQLARTVLARARGTVDSETLTQHMRQCAARLDASSEPPANYAEWYCYLTYGADRARVDTLCAQAEAWQDEGYLKFLRFVGTLRERKAQHGR